MCCKPEVCATIIFPPFLGPFIEKDTQVLQCIVVLALVANDLLKECDKGIKEGANFLPSEYKEDLQCFGRRKSPDIPTKDMHLASGWQYSSEPSGFDSSVGESLESFTEFSPSCLEGFL